MKLTLYSISYLDEVVSLIIEYFLHNDTNTNVQEKWQMRTSLLSAPS